MCDTKSFFTTTNTAIENFILSLDLSCYAIPGPQGGNMIPAGTRVFIITDLCQDIPSTALGSGIYIIPGRMVASFIVAGVITPVTSTFAPIPGRTLTLTRDANGDGVLIITPSLLTPNAFTCSQLSQFVTQ